MVVIYLNLRQNSPNIIYIRKNPLKFFSTKNIGIKYEFHILLPLGY